MNRRQTTHKRIFALATLYFNSTRENLDINECITDQIRNCRVRSPSRTDETHHDYGDDAIQKKYPATKPHYNKITSVNITYTIGFSGFVMGFLSAGSCHCHSHCLFPVPFFCHLLKDCISLKNRKFCGLAH